MIIAFYRDRQQFRFSKSFDEKRSLKVYRFHNETHSLSFTTLSQLLTGERKPVFLVDWKI